MKLKIFKFIKHFLFVYYVIYSLPILGCLQYFFLLICKDYLLRIIVYCLTYWKYYTFSSVWKHLTHFIAWILPKAYKFLVLYGQIYSSWISFMISLFNVMLRKIFELPDLCLYIYIYFFFFPSAFIVVVHFIILRIFHFLLTLIIVEKSAINLIRVFFWR